MPETVHKSAQQSLGRKPELFTSAYVQGGKLTIVGLCPCTSGVVPFTFKAKIEGEMPDGPVHLGSPNLHPAIVKILDKSEGAIMFQVEAARMEAAAHDLVDRARLGEQNAQATLIQIREAAQSDNPRAKAAYEMCVNYANKQPLSQSLVGPDRREAKRLGTPNADKMLDGPVTALGRAVAKAQNAPHYAATVLSHVPAVGGDMQSSQCAATALSHGPAINDNLLVTIKGAIGPAHAQSMFVAGVKLSANPRKVLEFAKAVAQKTKDGSLLQALQTGYTVGLAKRLQAIRKGAPLKIFSVLVAWEMGEECGEF